MSVARRINALWLALFAFVMLNVSQAQAAFVAADTNGVVTFDPSAVLTVVISAVVAAILAGVALFVLFKGTRYVYRALTLGK